MDDCIPSDDGIAMDDCIPSDDEILEWIDPDWRDHFFEVELAADHYRQWAPKEWAAAIKELS